MNSKSYHASCVSMRIRVNMRSKMVSRFSVSKLCYVSLSRKFSFRFSTTHFIYQSFFPKTQFSQYGAIPGILLQISLSPTALKVIGPFTPPLR